MISVSIVADSLNSCNNRRLTTFVLEYPRWIHSELLTHRVFSKNSSSSRAVPVEKMIKEVLENPAVPSFWGKNQKGMQAFEELPPAEIELAKKVWFQARDSAVSHAQELLKLGVHKQTANRILEPFFHMRAVLSGTEFENFFALRAHKDAQPELRDLAFLMLDLYNKNSPKVLLEGEWHIPFGDNLDESRVFRMAEKEMSHIYSGTSWGKDREIRIDEIKRKIAVARCARVSYLNFEGKDDYEADIDLCNKLFGSVPAHLSPTEHVAQAIKDDVFIGNFRGFKQLRKFINTENLSDNRVICKK